MFYSDDVHRNRVWFELELRCFIKKVIDMLVLTRKRSELIRIGDDIFIKVIRTGRSTVKIGIEAPLHVRVLRAELCEESKTAQRGDALELPK